MANRIKNSVDIQKIKNSVDIQVMKEDIKKLDNKNHALFLAFSKDLSYIFLFLTSLSIISFFNFKEGFILFAIISIMFYAVNKLYIDEAERDKKENEFLIEIKKNNLFEYYEKIEKIKKRMKMEEEINNF